MTTDNDEYVMEVLNDEDWGELRDASAPLDEDELDRLAEVDRCHDATRIAKSWAIHRVMLQRNLELCGVGKRSAQNASYGHGTVDDALEYLGPMYKKQRRGREVQKYKPINWRDADFWNVKRSWTRLMSGILYEGTPSELTVLIAGPKDGFRSIMAGALDTNHLAQIEFMAAHGVPMPILSSWDVCRSTDVVDAHNYGVRRYQINVMLVKSTLQLYFVDALAGTVMWFLSPSNAWGVAPDGVCLCLRCAREDA